ncbi:hypothetical protein ABEF92_004071 [Exophiala dermatitidis]
MLSSAGFEISWMNAISLDESNCIHFKRYLTPAMPLPLAFHDEDLNERADRLCAQSVTSVKSRTYKFCGCAGTVALVENSSAD